MKILYILKRGSEQEKASLMFFMLQDSGRVTLSQLRSFADKIEASEKDYREVVRWLKEFLHSGVELDDFVRVFEKLYKNNEIFNWMDCVVRPYKELEEAKQNEITKNKRQMANRKSISSLPLELHYLVLRERFDENIIKNLYLAHQKLQGREMLTVECLSKIIRDYQIKDPLATQLASRCLPPGKDTPEDFITVFYLLTQEKAVIKRNSLLFSLYGNDTISV